MTWRLLGLVFGLFCCQTMAVENPANLHNAVVLLYHHVDDNTPKSTSVTPAQFEAHMAYVHENFIVKPLDEVITALRNHTPLPDKTVVITFDDGYDNIYKNAHPILRKYGMPYTIFINPDVIGKQGNQLTWNEVSAMQKEGVSFANHTLDHLHMLNKLPNESQAGWLERVWQNVEQAEADIAKHTGQSLRYLAYPFGEYNQALAHALTEHGYVGFGQQSGAIGPSSDFTALPRYPAAGPYANLNSLKTKLASLAMPIDELSIRNPELTTRQLSDSVSFRVTSKDVGMHGVTCYFQGQPIPLEKDGNKVSFTLNKALPIGRSRVNCTAPSKKFSGRYYWYSVPFFIANDQGQYPD